VRQSKRDQKSRLRAAQHQAEAGLPATLHDLGPRTAEEEEREPRQARPRPKASAARQAKTWATWERKRDRRNFDDADRDTNAPFAHCSRCVWFWGGLLLLLILGLWSEWPSEAVQKEMRKEPAGDSLRVQGARVGGKPKKVTFDPNLSDNSVPRRRAKERKPKKGVDDRAEARSAPGKAINSLVHLQHLQGPEGAKDRWPAHGRIKVSTIQGEEYEPARLELILDRMAASTQKSYTSQFKWWELYCKRRRGGYDARLHHPLRPKSAEGARHREDALGSSAQPALVSWVSGPFGSHAESAARHGRPQEAIRHQGEAPSGNAGHAALDSQAVAADHCG
jgi:hypothetical protein